MDQKQREGDFVRHNRSLLKNLLFVVLIICMLLPVNISGEYYIYSNKYLSDSAIEGCSAWHGYWGGTPEVLCDEIDDLRLQTNPNWGQEEHAEIYIDGGRLNSNPWTFTQSYYDSIKIYWKMKGDYYGNYGGDWFKFEYNLYYIWVNQKISFLTYTYEYLGAGGWNTLTLISHSLGSLHIDSSKTYYLEIDIKARSLTDYEENEFWGGSDHIEFVKAEFAYYA